MWQTIAPLTNPPRLADTEELWEIEVYRAEAVVSRLAALRCWLDVRWPVISRLVLSVTLFCFGGIITIGPLEKFWAKLVAAASPAYITYSYEPAPGRAHPYRLRVRPPAPENLPPRFRIAIVPWCTFQANFLSFLPLLVLDRRLRNILAGIAAAAFLTFTLNAGRWAVGLAAIHWDWPYEPEHTLSLWFTTALGWLSALWFYQKARRR